MTIWAKLSGMDSDSKILLKKASVKGYQFSGISLRKSLLIESIPGAVPRLLLLMLLSSSSRVSSRSRESWTSWCKSMKLVALGGKELKK